MPAPNDERQALEQERCELRARLTTDHQELEVTPPQTRTRREFLVWRIRQAELRLAAIEARLAALNFKAGE